MLKKIILVLAAIIIVFLVIAALQPADYRVVRSISIGAPAPAVFAQVNDFHRWDAWSPWAKLDPAMKQSYEGAPSGTGAIYIWAGNTKVGEGRMTINESRPDELVRLTLDFIKPFKSTASTEFTFKPEGNQTTVTWAMSGQRNFMSKAIGIFMSMDKMIGGDFEKGLTQMKSVAETASK